MSKLSDALGLPRNPNEHSLHIAIVPLSYNLNDILIRIAHSKSLIPVDYIITTQLIDTTNVYQILANLAADGIDGIITIGTCYGYTNSIGDIIEPSILYANDISIDNTDPYNLNTNIDEQYTDITGASHDLRLRFDLRRLHPGHYDTHLYEIENACKDLKLIHTPLQIVTNCFDSSIADNMLRNKSTDILEYLNKCYITINKEFTNIGEA